MKKRDDGPQLTLDFSQQEKTEVSQKAACRVTPFVDAATLETRRSAVRRVASSGIFKLPSNLRVR